MRRLLEDAGRTARNGDLPVEDRGDAVRLLTHAPFALASAPLGDLLNARQPPELQLAAVQALSEQAHPDVAKIFVKHWRTISPQVRREAAEVLFRRPERVYALVEGLKSKQVLASELDPVRRKALLEHSDPEIGKQAKALLGDERSGGSKSVVEAYRGALRLQGDLTRGATVFRKLCVNCHRLKGEGNIVGPDLTATTDRPGETLLRDILDPNHDLPPGYENMLLEMNDGRLVSGVIVFETPTSVTLRRAEGVEETVLRKNIIKIRSSRVSLMPTDLESGLDLQQMADLIAFLKGGP